MKRTFVKNGSTEYYIIDATEKKLLLQRKSDGEIVIGYNYEYKDGTVSWQQGYYYGDGLVHAASEFYKRRGS